MTLWIDLEKLIQNRLMIQATMAIILANLIKSRFLFGRTDFSTLYKHFKICSIAKFFQKAPWILLFLHSGLLSHLKSQYAKKPKNPV